MNNVWYMLAYRRLDQWVRRQFWTRLRPARRWEIINDSRGEDGPLPPELIWKLGLSISVYQFTPEQQQRQRELTRQIIQDLKAQRSSNVHEDY